MTWLVMTLVSVCGGMGEVEELSVATNRARDKKIVSGVVTDGEGDLQKSFAKVLV